MKRKILVFVLAAVLWMGCVPAGCGKKDDPNDNQPPVIPDTEYSLSKGGETDYKILAAAEAGEKTVFAVSELETLFTEATGVKPEIVYDNEYDASYGKYLSIGQNSLMRAKGLKADYAVLGEVGSQLTTQGETLFMFGATGYGDINAVYEFMRYTFGYRYYAENEYALEKKDGAKLKLFDTHTVPDFDNMCLMYGELFKGVAASRRLKTVNYYDTWISTLYAHTYFKILPRDLYLADHDDWYSPDDTRANLCLTRSSAMIDEFVARCKTFIEADPARNYFMLGQEDNFGFCGCESCAAEIERLGSSSAVMMIFTNKVVKRLNEWLAAEHPERNVTFVTFAYNHTKQPPVKVNAATGTYEPVVPEVVAEDNLSVMFVINMVDYFAPYSKDSTVMNMLKGWSGLTKNLTIWQYCTNFDDYMQPFENWGSMQPNYALLKQYGVQYVVEQGSHNTAAANFSEMRQFVQAELSWDVQAKTTELVDEFMRVYYKQAYEPLRSYYDALTNHFASLVADKGLRVTSGGNEVMTAENWDYNLLLRLQSYMDAAFEAIEPLKTSDKTAYETLYNRVLKESVIVRYYMLKFNGENFSDYNKRYAQLVSDCIRFGITNFSEKGTW